MATAYETGYTAGQNVQPGQTVSIPDEFTADPGVHQQYVDGLQAGMNAQMAAAQAAAAPAPTTFTLPDAVSGVTQEPPVTTAVTGVAQTAPQAVSMLQQMAAELDQRPVDVGGPNTTPAVTSSGGFALLEGLEDDLDKGSGKPFLFENVDDKLVGIVKYRDEIRSDYANPRTGQYGMVMLLDIEDTDGNLWSVRGYGSALASQLEKADPKVNDAIAIKFIGMEQPKTAGYQPYKNFVVRVRHA